MKHPVSCLACGAPLQGSLLRTGSLRCYLCRLENLALDASLVTAWQARLARAAARRSTRPRAA